jgi:hypothetical protein
VIRFWIGVLLIFVGCVTFFAGHDYALTVQMAETAYGVPWWGAILGGFVVGLT